MSELKAYTYDDMIDGDADTNTEYYPKSEVDKVIAEKDKTIAELKDKLQNVSELLKETREWLIESQRMHKRCADGAIKKIRHRNFKWCSAMADYCYTNVHCIMGHRLCALADWKKEWFERWHQRWLALADKYKYKEAK